MSTASTEPSFGERWLPCRNRRRHSRSLVSSDYGDALWETIGETVMLVCLSSAARVSALAFLLARSLDWVPRYSRSHLCSGSDIRKEPFQQIKYHTCIATGDLRLQVRFLPRARDGVMTVCMYETARTCTRGDMTIQYISLSWSTKRVGLNQRLT